MNDLLKSNEGMELFCSSNDYNELKELLGKYCDEITTFYYNACINDDYKYKIFLTRRSYVLYRFFSAMFKKFISDYEEKGEIFNTYSLPELKEAIKNDNNAKILVADDLIIHGRSIIDIQEELKTVVSVDNISLWCILFSDGAEFVNPDKFDYVRVVSMEEWKKFSDCVTKFIITTNIGYVSIYDTYYTDKKNADELCKICENKNAYIVTKYDEKNKIECKIAFFNKINRCIEDQLISCIRFYNSNNKTTIIPTVILPPYKKGECVDNCIKILQNKDIQIPKYFSKMNVEKMYLETMRLLSNQLLKDNCGKKEYYIYECKETYKFDEYNNKSSYMKKEYSDISGELELCGKYFHDSVIKYLHNKNDEHLFINNSINEYLLNIRVEDEKRAFIKRDRIFGIQIRDIVKILSEYLGYNDKTIYDIIANVIWNWDSGKSAYIVKTYLLENEYFIGGVIRNGEQAFRLNYELNNIQYSALYYYFRKTGNYKFFDIKDFMRVIDCEFNTNIFTEFIKN